MANIYTEVKVEESISVDGTVIYTMCFDGAIAQVEDCKPTEEMLHWFKKGVLSERERIWDVDVSDQIDDHVMKALLNINDKDDET